jgi:hypothetical protein
MKIFNKTDLRKYFIHDDVLKSIVGIVTGIFIVYFNFFGGLLIADMIYEIIFLKFYAGNFRFVLIIPLGLALGYLLLKLIIDSTIRIFKSDGMEEYSLIRILLLASIIVYILILAMYFIFFLLKISLGNF